MLAMAHLSVAFDEFDRTSLNWIMIGCLSFENCRMMKFVLQLFCSGCSHGNGVTNKWAKVS